MSRAAANDAPRWTRSRPWTRSRRPRASPVARAAREGATIFGFGSAGIDYVAELDGEGFVVPDGKHRASTMTVCGGGNCANALTAASRLGARCFVGSEVGDDAHGETIARELERDGVDCRFLTTRPGTSGFTYVLVSRGENGDRRRTCVHTPGRSTEATTLAAAAMTSERAKEIMRAVDPDVVYFDGRLTERAIVLAREAKTRGARTRVLVEAERLRDGLDELVGLADVVVTSKTYPMERFPECASLADAMMRVMTELCDDETRVIVTTLGARGSVALVREDIAGVEDEPAAGARLEDVFTRLETLAYARKTKDDVPAPSASAIAFVATDSTSERRTAMRVIFAPAMTLTDEEIVDTTGAGDAFIGTLAVAAGMEGFVENLGETMRLGSYVAAQKCRGVGARSALPRAEDIPSELTEKAEIAIGPTSVSSRRTALAFVIFGGFATMFADYSSEAATNTDVAEELNDLFNRAMQAPTYEESEKAWTRAIEIAPRGSPARSAALSNRGTLRLQYSEWEGAVQDLQESVDDDGDRPDALALNNLGNALGALGRWDEAMSAYLEASRIEDMREIALANYALAAFQIERADLAMRTLRKVLRRDPEFLDGRAALSAFLWAEGDFDEAEAQWTFLCKSGRGFGAKRSAEDVRDDGAIAYGVELFKQSTNQIVAELDGGVKDAGLDTPCRLYKSTDVVANRWPPRATAALDAFLRVRRDGQALDYDGAVKTYDFNTR